MCEQAGGDVAVALFNKAGGAPPGVLLVESGHYCSNHQPVDNTSTGFGYTLQTCHDAVVADKFGKCGGGGATTFFTFAQQYNGQCACAKDQCAQRGALAVYTIYQVDPTAPATGIDITVDFSEVMPDPPAQVAVLDIWTGRMSLHTSGSYTAKNVPEHGSAFIRLS